MGHLKTLDFVVIGIYALGTLFVGWWCARRQESTEEYFVGNRRMGSTVVGLSMIATLLSTISYLTTPGEMIKNGPGLAWGLAALPLSFFVVGYFVIPRIMKYEITSAYELLEGRFGMAVRQAAAVLFMLVRITWMGLIVFTCSKAVVTITGMPIHYVLIVVGVLATVYTVMGGIRAVIITDVIQFMILFGGALLVLAYVSYRCGGLSWWPDWGSPALADLHWPKVKLFSLSPFDRVTIVAAMANTFLWWVCTASSDQVMIQRYLCTRDARNARRSYLYCLSADLAISLVLWTVGIALLGFFLRFPQELADGTLSVVEQADKLFPHFIGAILPAGVSGLLVGALFAAAMSSLDSGISSISTVLLTDFRNIVARGCNNDERSLLRRARWLGVVVGALAIVETYAIQYVPGKNLVEVAMRIGNFFVVPLFMLFVLAFFIRFSTPAGAWSAIIVGFITGVLFSYWQQIVGLFIDTGDFSIVLIMPLSLLCSFAAGILVSAVTKPRVVVENKLLERMRDRQN